MDLEYLKTALLITTTVTIVNVAENVLKKKNGKIMLSVYILKKVLNIF